MSDFVTNFSGTVTIRIDHDNPRLSRPFINTISLSPIFSGDRLNIDLGKIDSIVTDPSDTPLGMNTTTVSKVSGGVGGFNQADGALVVPLRLLFHHSNLFAGGDSTVDFLLTTGRTTSPNRKFSETGRGVNRSSGMVKLVGASKFVGGLPFALGGRDCSISILGRITPSPFVTDRFRPPLYQRGCPGDGIGGYDLAEPADRVFAFDYDSSGKMDHLVLYRPGHRTIWIVKHTGSSNFQPVYSVSAGDGIGGYDLAEPADRVFAFDYDSSGKMDHLVMYRPGFGTLWILKHTGGSNFQPVYAEGSRGTGIGGYDLAEPADRVFGFDYDKNGKTNHLTLYRPGTGTIWILKST